MTAKMTDVEKIDLIKIIGTYYDVVYRKNLKDNKNDGLYGHIEFDELIIKVCSRYPALRQLQTILHESIHGICQELDIEMCEHHVEVFSNALFGYLLDNKVFIEMILNYKKGTDHEPD